MGQETQAEQYGSVAQGLSGDYRFSVGGLISEAWRRIDGNKGKLWMALLLYIVVGFVVGLIFGMLGGGSPPPEAGEAASRSAIDLIGDLVRIIILMPIAAGLGFCGVAVALGKVPVPMSVFGWYDQTLKIFLLTIVMNILMAIGLLLLILPGIYLAVSYQLALPLMLDKKMGIWEAMETSRKIVGHNWFGVLGLDLIMGLAVGLSMMLLGIPLIWVAPAIMAGFGILYRDAAGIEEDTLQRALGGS